MVQWRLFAHLEGSKLHAKQVMKSANIPTADFHVLDFESNIDAALDDFSDQPWVVKRDVLAGGKGVVVTEDRFEARNFILFNRKRRASSVGAIPSW